METHADGTLEGGLPLLHKAGDMSLHLPFVICFWSLVGRDRILSVPCPFPVVKVLPTFGFQAYDQAPN